MILLFFRIHINRFFRTLSSIGIIRAIVVIIFLVLAIAAIIKLSFSEKNQNLIILISIFSILSLHLNRTDKNFLLHLRINRYVLFICEYFILSTIIWIPMFISGKYINAIYLIIAILALAMFTKNIKYKFEQTPFAFLFLHTFDFEWISGLRKSLFPLVLLFLFSLLGIKYIWIIPLVIFIMAFIISGFYQECEPSILLDKLNFTSWQIIRFKLYRSIINFTFLVGIPAILFLIFHFESSIVLLISFLACIIIIFFSIMMKYSMYSPGCNLSGNNILIGIFTIFLIIPYLLPVALLLFIRYARLASKNLKSYA